MLADDAPVGVVGWRSLLGRKLLGITLILTILATAFFASGIGAHPGWMWWVIGPSCIAVLTVLAVRRSTTDRQRALGVVTVLLVAATAGYARFAHVPGPALAILLAVVVSGLLLGRRAMYVTGGLAALAVSAVGVAMVEGYLAGPRLDELEPTMGRVWIRTTTFTITFAFIVAAVVTWVVEQVEVAAARAEHETARRHEAERKGLEAQQADLMGQVAARLAHDVNNHLAVISMWSSVLLASRSEEDLEEATDEIGAAIEQATALTRRVLVLGRRGVRTPRPTSLTALVADHASMLRRMLGATITLEIERPETDAWCHADEGQLNQVLLNLAMNARDALPDGGKVTIRTGRRPNGHDYLAFLTVEDTGVGMTEEVRRRATEPFFSTKPAGKGSGLGLAAVAAVARQSDATLELESSPGNGTRVTFALASIAAPATAAAPPAAPPILTARVLLVDDSPALVQIARRTLQDAGCTVIVAGDGDEALQRIGESRFDALCSDVVMPGCPVRDVIAAFEARNPAAPVLLCSGYVGEELVRRGIEAGRYRFLAKPYGPAQLVAEIATVLREASRAPAAIAEAG
ncbi:MAG TPA: ATP-binding protein [Kofleriaceae bacterium]|nr:ATP-binding protein [Kofleriaceae bacterium]